MLGLAFLRHIIGSTSDIGAPYIVPQGGDVQTRVNAAFWVLSAAMLLVVA